MKKAITYLFVFLFTSISFSQITLEKTYSNVKTYNFKSVKLDDENFVYYSLNDIDDIIGVYDENHNLIKNISIPSAVKNGRDYIQVYHLSKYLFDLDDEFEYLVSFYEQSSTEYYYSSYVLNEDGTVLLDGTNFFISANGIPGGLVKDLSGDYKLVLENLVNSDSSKNEVKVYALPGELYTLKTEEERSIKGLKVYPNPTLDKQNIIKHGYLNSGIVKVYNHLGQFVKEVDLKRNQGQTIINLAKYPSGLYHYQIFDGRKKIGKEKVLLN